MQERLQSISLTEFLSWEQEQEQKHELVNGRVVAFSGSSFDHNDISLNVCSALLNRLKPPCRVYNSDAIVETIRVKGDNGFRPDAAVTCSQDDSGTGRYMQHPCIIVEVRSPSNVGRDWEDKLFEYRDTPSIEQLVIIESETRSLTSYVRDAQGKWQPGKTTIHEGTLEFSAVGVEMTLDEIYRRTSLDLKSR